MYKSITVLAAVSVLCLSVDDVTGQEKKYDIKSGIVTFENTMAMGGLKIANKAIVYFDDYGMKECKETFEDGKLKESFFSDGKILYKLLHGNKEAYKMGDAFRGTELRCDWNEVSERDKKAGKAKQLPRIAVAGKQCDAFQVVSSSGTTTFAGWSHICLLTELTSKKMSSVAKAVSIQENAKVSPDKFKVPAGYQLKQ